MDEQPSLLEIREQTDAQYRESQQLLSDLGEAYEQTGGILGSHFATIIATLRTHTGLLQLMDQRLRSIEDEIMPEA